MVATGMSLLRDMTRDLLIIMARYPRRGRVKTRLAKDIGHRAATELYRSFLKHFASEFARAPFDVEWRYTPARAPFRRLLLREFGVHALAWGQGAKKGRDTLKRGLQTC